MTAFQDFVNTEIPLRVSIGTSPGAVAYPRFTGIGKAVEARTAAQFVADIAAASSARNLTVAGTTDEVSSSAGAQDLTADRTWTLGIADNPIMPGNEALTLPKGTTAQRPSTPLNSMMRYNTTESVFEVYNGEWLDMAGANRVNGPASAVDKEVCRFDGATGKKIEGGNGTLFNDDGSVTIVGDMSFGTAFKALFRDTQQSIGSPSASKLRLDSGSAGIALAVGGNEQFKVHASGADIGSGAAGVDYYLRFDGETNDGKLTWMEDEARFDFDSKVKTSQQFESAIATGTAPLIVASTTVVANLNASLLEGNAASAFLKDVLDDTTPEFGGEVDAGAHTIGFTAQSATGDLTTTIDWKLGNKFNFTFGAFTPEVFTFTAPSNPCNLTLQLKQDSIGSRAATWPAAVKWAGGTAPTLTTAANAVDVVTFYFNGTDYIGTIVLDAK